MVNRIVVGAHYGLKDWLIQRVTAVVMAVWLVVMLGLLLVQGPFSHESWRSLMSGFCMRAFTGLFFLSLMYHAWVGVRNIFMDYIKASGLRLTLYVVVILALIAYGAWTVQILWGK